MWSQALGPLESPAEHNTNRIAVAQNIVQHHKDEYERVFGAIGTAYWQNLEAIGAFSNREVQFAWRGLNRQEQQDITQIFVNVGKALAAYQRTITFRESRFDVYSKGFTGFNAQEEQGLALFLGKGNCISCHNTPLFSDQNFHNTGLQRQMDIEAEDMGRASGLRDLLNSDFTCASAWSDTKSCSTLENLLGELEDENADPKRFLDAFKTPSLRNVAKTFPYMHSGQIGSLRLAISHYATAPKAIVGQSEIAPKSLSQPEVLALEAFLKTLSSDFDAPPQFLQNPYR